MSNLQNPVPAANADTRVLGDGNAGMQSDANGQTTGQAAIQPVSARRVPDWVVVLSPKTRYRVAVALVGYLVVVVFLLAFAIVNHARDWFGIPAAAQPLALAFAGLLAAPLALAFVWERLSAVKVFNFEVDLAAITTQLSSTLPSELQGNETLSFPQSFDQTIVAQMRAAIRQGENGDLLEVDFGHHWRSTRLYLVAALAQDYTAARQIVFTQTGPDGNRRFIGFASPAHVCQALAEQTPALEVAYFNAITSTVIFPRLLPADEATQVIPNYFFKLQTQDPKVVGLLPQDAEKVIKIDISGEMIRQLLGTSLVDAAVDWQGGAVSSPVVFQIISQRAPFVALLKNGKLDRIVNRSKLAIQIATAAVRQELNSTSR